MGRKAWQAVLAGWCTLLVCPFTAGAALPQQSGTLDLASPGAGAVKIRGIGGAGSWAGYAVADAGDVNGDGADDLIIGAPQADNPASNAGSAYVLFGPIASDINLSSLGGRGFMIRGAQGSDFLGRSVTGVGDMNGDGRADVAVGAPGAGAPDLNPPGAAYVIFGKTDTATVDVGALGPSGFSVVGPQNDGIVGAAVTGVPDMNGDGKPELGVSGTDVDPLTGTDAGAAWVVFDRGPGSMALSSLGASEGLYVRGPGASTYAGFGLAGLPDLNGDERGELATGAVGAFASEGGVFVTFGQSPGGAVDMATAPGLTFRRSGASADLGQAVAALGDQNGDGKPDLLIGSRGSYAYGSRSDAGQAFVAFGMANGPAPDLGSGGGFEIGGAAGERAGYSVSGTGDVNGAGGPDFALTAPCADPGGRTNAGSAYVVFRDTSRTSADLAQLTLGSEDLRIDGPQTNGTCETAAQEADMSVAGTGDLTGDGRPDVVVGTPRADTPGTDDGGAWIVLGWGAPGFTFPASASATRGQAIAPLAPSGVRRTGTARFAITPALPAGLSLDPASGAISGTPTEGSPARDYSVTLTDLAGETSQPLRLTVDVPAPAPVDPCVAAPASCTPKARARWPKLRARFDFAFSTKARITQARVYDLSSTNATLTFRCVHCQGEPSRTRFTVRAPLTPKRLRIAMARAIGLRVNAKSLVQVSIRRKNAIGVWFQASKGPTFTRRCIPANKAKPQRTCPTLIP